MLYPLPLLYIVGVILLSISTSSFSFSSRSSVVSSRIPTSLSSTTNLISDEERNEENRGSMQKRRGFLSSSIGVTLLSLPFTPQIAFGVSDEVVSSPSGAICVIGANGKTGSECVGACIARNINVIATSRGGEYYGAYNTEENRKGLLESKICDVTIPSTIEEAVEGSRAVIFAASASKAGGTAAAVDNVGLVNVAKVCIEKKVPHLVIVSSGAVTKPDSPVYKFLNLFGNIMEEKIKGEDAVRKLYADKSVSEATYTVIRPGGLTEEDALGVSALELNQGDNKSGRIARADVASLCIEATLNPKLTGKTTFECYNGETGKPLQTVGLSNILKQKSKADDVVFMSGKERRGSTFTEIFTGLEQD